MEVKTNLLSKSNGITINNSLKCNKAGNYTSNKSRTVDRIVMHYTGNSKDTAKANACSFSHKIKKVFA